MPIETIDNRKNNGSSGIITADNGLNLNTSTNVELGGTLIKDTDINTGLFRFFVHDAVNNTVQLYVGSHTGSQRVLMVVKDIASAAISQILIHFDLISIQLFSANPTLNKEIVITPTQWLIQDTLQNNGMSYAADYHVNNAANPRWIPDKGYIDSLTVTADNGLSINAGHNVELGGLLIKPTVIDSGISNALVFEDVTNSTIQVGMQAGLTPSFLVSVTDPAGDSTSLTVQPLLWGFSVARTAGGQKAIAVSPTGFVVTDTIQSIGMTYAADYSVNNISNPRWIPDKGYIDKTTGKITSGSAIGQGTSALILTTTPTVVTLLRLNVGFIYVSGIGTASLAVTYTDLNGNVDTIPLGTLSGAGILQINPVVIMSAASAVNLNLTITGTAVASVMATFEKLL